MVRSARRGDDSCRVGVRRERNWWWGDPRHSFLNPRRGGGEDTRAPGTRNWYPELKVYTCLLCNKIRGDGGGGQVVVYGDRVFFGLLKLARHRARIPGRQVLNSFGSVRSASTECILIELLSRTNLCPSRVTKVAGHATQKVQRLLTQGVASPVVKVCLRRVEGRVEAKHSARHI